MAGKRQVTALATKMGATITINSRDPLDVEVDAPDGCHWLADGPCDGDGSGVHFLVGHQYIGDPAVAMWHDLYGRMRCGYAKCPPGCEANAA